MKILICTGIYPPEIGGPATYTKNLAEGLAKLGHDVEVITYADKSDQVRKSDYPIHLIFRSRFRAWHYFKYYRAVLRYGKAADVIFAQGAVSDGYPAYLANKKLQKSMVVKITGDYSWEQAVNRGLTVKLIDEFQSPQSYHPKIKKMREIQTTVCKSAGCIIVPSKYLKDLVVGWGVDADKITVIYNSATLKSSRDRDAARRKLNLADEDFLILSAARPVKWKGFEILREIYESLKKQHPNFKLKILTQADQQEVFDHYAAADLFALNTGYEGFSHTILEAMAAGLPVITTRAGGNTEIVEDKVNGILIDYNSKEQLHEAILVVYENKDLRANLIRNALDTVSDFKVNLTMDNMIEQTVGVLQKCGS